MANLSSRLRCLSRPAVVACRGSQLTCLRHVKGGMNMGKPCLQSRPGGPAPKISPARKGWVHSHAVERRRCGTTLFVSASALQLVRRSGCRRGRGSSRRCRLSRCSSRWGCLRFTLPRRRRSGRRRNRSRLRRLRGHRQNSRIDHRRIIPQLEIERPVGPRHIQSTCRQSLPAQ